MANPEPLPKNPSTNHTTLHLPPSLPYILQEYTATNFSSFDLDACLRLIEVTSSAAYRASSKGWSSRAKKLEMRDPDMRYLILRKAEDALNLREDSRVSEQTECIEADGTNTIAVEIDNEETGEERLGVEKGKVEGVDWEENLGDNIPGFISYMHTIDDGVPVVYIYEIHLAQSLRNLGIGRRLMEIVESAGQANGDTKAMLTVFLSNKDGIKFYENLGYSKWDEEYVPVKRRRLRSGTKETKPSYIIMAKELTHQAMNN